MLITVSVHINVIDLIKIVFIDTDIPLHYS